MRSNGGKAVPIIAWLIGGFVLAMLALFSVFGGLLLGLLMVTATPLVVGFLVVEALFGKRPVYVTSAKTEEALPVAPVRAVPAHRVLVRVVRAQGTCPQGYRFNVGDTWVLNGDIRGDTPLCPSAYRLLAKHAERARRGQVEVTPRPQCCSNGHTVEFEVRPEETRSLATAQPHGR